MIRKEKFPIVRMGIVGTGRIAPRFMSESKYVSGIEVECAYNPEMVSAIQFENEENIPVYTEKYADFLQHVDAVYIASPNETHYQYAREALLNGKHVLSEKPLAFTYNETFELYELAKKMHVVLMEGIKTAYCPGFQQLMNVAKSGKIGIYETWKHVFPACKSSIKRTHRCKIWWSVSGVCWIHTTTYF